MNSEVKIENTNEAGMLTANSMIAFSNIENTSVKNISSFSKIDIDFHSGSDMMYS